MARDRQKTREAIEAMGGSYSPSSSSSSDGTRQERDAVENAMSWGTMAPNSDTEQAPQTSLMTGPDGSHTFEIGYNPQQIAQSNLTPQQAFMHEGTHGVNHVAGWTAPDAGWNMNLPADPAQEVASYQRQTSAMDANLEKLKSEASRDYDKSRITKSMRDHIHERADYGIQRGTHVEYPTIVNELVEKMRAEIPGRTKRDQTRSYAYLDKLRTANREARGSGSAEQAQVQGYPQGRMHQAGMTGYPTPGGGSKRQGSTR